MHRYICLEHYDLNYLVDYFKDKVTKEYRNIERLEDVLKEFQRNNYRIALGTLTKYDRYGWTSKFSCLKDIKELKKWYKDNKVSLLDEFINDINNSLSRLNRGYSII